MPLPQPKLLSPIPSRYLAKNKKNSVSLVANYKKNMEDKVSKLRVNRDLENLSIVDKTAEMLETI